MSIAAAIPFTMASLNETTTVPDNDVARLMYYLGSVTVGSGTIPSDLIDFKNFQTLAPERIAEVFKTAVQFAPALFDNKIIFKDNMGRVVRGESLNKFLHVTEAYDYGIPLERYFTLPNGQKLDVSKVMFYNPSWIDTYYEAPLDRIARILLDTKHCQHCPGKGVLACARHALEAAGACASLPMR